MPVSGEGYEMVTRCGEEAIITHTALRTLADICQLKLNVTVDNRRRSGTAGKRAARNRRDAHR